MKKHFLLISKSKFFIFTLLLVTAFSFSAFINGTSAAEMSGYQIDKSSSGAGKVDRIDITSFTLNFGATAGTITLDGINATFNDWSTNKIGWVVVPSQVEGVADVVVTTAEGTQLNIGSFTVNPKITSISPSPAYTGQELIINGEGFRELADCGGILTGDGNKINVSSWSDTRIVVNLIKNQPLGIGQHQLTVKSCGNSSLFPVLVKQAVCDTEEDWACTGWGSCSIDGIKTRTCTQEFACDSVGTPPATTQTCTPACNADTWSCGDWESCSTYGTQNRTCTKTYDCSTAYTPLPVTSQNCTPPCYSDTWSCGNWTTCTSNGSQTRVCNKTNDCATADTPSPATVQNCTPPQPTCTADTWSCDSWGSCSLSGIQSRNCSKTFDCPSVQTAPPITDQFCEAPNRPQQTAPSEFEEITNQDTIIKATVKLLCPVDERQASQGSGTVIDSVGTILTNKHVIAGTLGCLVGFIDDFSDEPYFGDRQIADIVKVSSNQDIAVLKIRNPKNKALPYVNTTNGNVNFALGTKITTYGYPAKFGTKITYTSGDFSGNDGGFFKTTAILEYGNSGGGAYLKNGTYIGIPSAVVKGELNAMGYILSINTIRAWLNNSGVASGATNNNYSRVSVLEDIDLKKLGSLKLFIPDVDKNSNLVTPATNQNTQKTTDQPQVSPQQESVVIESNNLNKDSTSSVQNASTTPEQPQKISLIKRFFLWLSNLFDRLAKP